MRQYLRIGLAGEVDAGKSTLIGRFLYDSGSVSIDLTRFINAGLEDKNKSFDFSSLLDSLKEERDGQLTLDTTQVFCRNKKGKDFLFIDVPGHGELFKNMLCGSSYADAAILVMDVNKPLDEGAKRHGTILNFLGIREIVVVLNKMDISGFSEELYDMRKSEIVSFLGGLGIKPKYIIPVSAKAGNNLVDRFYGAGWYKGLTLKGVLNSFYKIIHQARETDFIFPVQDVYTKEKEVISVGNIESGSIRKGQAVRVLPSGFTAKIEAIKSYPKNKHLAVPGDAVGLVLDDARCPLKRGQIIYRGSALLAVNKISAKVLCVCDLDISQKFLLKCATQCCGAHIKEIKVILNPIVNKCYIGLKKLSSLDMAEVNIELDSRISFKKNNQFHRLGRFILSYGQEICAVGFVI